MLGKDEQRRLMTDVIQHATGDEASAVEVSQCACVRVGIAFPFLMRALKGLARLTTAVNGGFTWVSGIAFPFLMRALRRAYHSSKRWFHIYACRHCISFFNARIEGIIASNHSSKRWFHTLVGIAFLFVYHSLEKGFSRLTPAVNSSGFLKQRLVFSPSRQQQWPTTHAAR